MEIPLATGQKSSTFAEEQNDAPGQHERKWVVLLNLWQARVSSLLDPRQTGHHEWSSVQTLSWWPPYTQRMGFVRLPVANVT